MWINQNAEDIRFPVFDGRALLVMNVPSFVYVLGVNAHAQSPLNAIACIIQLRYDAARNT